MLWWGARLYAKSDRMCETVRVGEGGAKPRAKPEFLEPVFYPCYFILVPEYVWFFMNLFVYIINYQIIEHIRLYSVFYQHPYQASTLTVKLVIV